MIGRIRKYLFRDHPTPRRAFIHIGLHKTGTTAIQQAMYEARGCLSNAGVHYAPGTNHSLPLCSLFLSSRKQFIWSQHVSDAGLQELKNKGAAIGSFIKARDGTVVLSGEDLSMLDAEGVARFGEWITDCTQDITVLCYVRNVRAWASSQAQQSIKGGATLGDLHSNPPIPRFQRRLSSWVSRFGRQSVKVFDYDACQCQSRGVVGHFMKTVGAPDELVSTAAMPRTNQSLSDVAVRWLDELNRARQRRPPSEAEKQAAASMEGPPFRLASNVLSAAVERAENDISWLRGTFGVDLS